MADSPRYLLVWDRMGDYHVARWRALQHLLGPENVYAADLHAADGLYGWKTSWVDDSQYVRLSSKIDTESDVLNRITTSIRVLKEKRITHVALAGYGRMEYRLLALYARLTGIHVTLFAESWYPATAPWKDKIKGGYVSLLGHTFLVSGVRAARHFAHNLGISSSRIATGYSVVDNDHFASLVGQVSRDKTILCVARFAPEKNLIRLVEAFATSALPSLGFTLKLVGGGPLLSDLEALAAFYPWLRIHTWVAYKELPALYATAHAFILPSLFEPWGLVVNEALAAHLPVACSKEVGALDDLIGPNEALTFSAEDIAGMASILTLLAKATPKTSAKLDSFTPSTWATSLVQLGQL